MAAHYSATLTNARAMASRYRSKGFIASVSKKKKGYCISVTRQ